MRSALFAEDLQLQRAASNSPPLCVGASGSGVQKLQAALSAVGYALPVSFRSGQADGVFGSETRTAVCAFQRDYPDVPIPVTAPVGSEAHEPPRSGNERERAWKVAETSSEPGGELPQHLGVDGVAGKNTLTALDAYLVRPGAGSPGRGTQPPSPGFVLAAFPTGLPAGFPSTPVTASLSVGVSVQPENASLDPALIRLVVRDPTGTVLAPEHRAATNTGAAFLFTKVPSGSYVATAFVFRRGAKQAFATGTKVFRVAPSTPNQHVATDVFTRAYTLTLSHATTAKDFPKLSSGETVDFTANGPAGEISWKLTGPGRLSAATGPRSSYTAVLPSGVAGRSVTITLSDLGNQEVQTTLTLKPSPGTCTPPPQTRSPSADRFSAACNPAFRVNFPQGPGAGASPQDECPLPQGKFRFRLVPRGRGTRKGGIVDVKLEFIPGTTLAASNSTISFIQIVSSSLWNSDGSSEVDTTRNDVGPYYGARWDEGSQEWVDEPTATQAPGSPMGSTEGSRRFSASNASAILNDSPMMDDGETKYFETAIVIIESGQILGSFFWTVRNDSGITLARNVHLETSASAELSAVLRCFYVRNPINIRPKDGSAPSDLR